MFDESTRLCDVKYKIVFLGQSAVGKSALIERFIQGSFDPRKTVHPPPYRKLLASTFLLKMLPTMARFTDCNSGTRPDRKNSKA